MNAQFQEFSGSIPHVANHFKFTVIQKLTGEAGPWFTATPLQITAVLIQPAMP